MADVANNRHVLISINPKAGRKSPRARAERLMKALQDKGFAVELQAVKDLQFGGVAVFVFDGDEIRAEFFAHDYSLLSLLLSL